MEFKRYRIMFFCMFSIIVMSSDPFAGCVSPIDDSDHRQEGVMPFVVDSDGSSFDKYEIFRTNVSDGHCKLNIKNGVGKLYLPSGMQDQVLIMFVKLLLAQYEENKILQEDIALLQRNRESHCREINEMQSECQGLRDECEAITKKLEKAQRISRIRRRKLSNKTVEVIRMQEERNVVFEQLSEIVEYLKRLQLQSVVSH